MSVKLDVAQISEGDTLSEDDLLNAAMGQMDTLLAKGKVKIMMIDPEDATGDKIPQYISLANYKHNQPGIISMASAIKEGKLADVHGDKTLSDIMLLLFADVAKTKGTAFVIDALSKVDASAKTAQMAAKVNAWRDMLDMLVLSTNGQVYISKGKGDKRETVQSVVTNLVSERDTAQAIADGHQDSIDKVKGLAASVLDIDKTFDIAVLPTGLYIPTETTAKSTGTRTVIKRVWDKLVYTVDSKIDGVAYTAKATKANVRKDTGDDGSIADWTVVYKCEGKTYTGKSAQGTLNSANKIARTKMIKVVAPKMSLASHAPNLFGVKRIAS